MDSIIFGGFALLYLALLIWLMKAHRWTLSSVLILVILALIYDNGIFSLGRIIGEGAALETLNVLRFWLHAAFTPMLILFSVAIMREAGIGWAKKPWVLIVGVIYMLVAMVIEYVESLKGLTLEAVKEYGALSYSSTEPASGPPIMILFVLVALLVAGVMLWWKAKWPWMFVGTVIMTIGSAVPLDVGSNAITNAFELCLLFTLVWTKKKVDAKQVFSY